MSVKERDYGEIVEALTTELRTLDATLSELTDDQWQSSTRLTPFDPDNPPWRLPHLVRHIDIATHMVRDMVDAEGSDLQLERDHVSFFIFDRPEVAPIVYDYAIQEAEGLSSTEILGGLKDTIEDTIQLAHTTPPDLEATAYFGSMRLEDMVITRVLEAVVHGIDVTDALGVDPHATDPATAITAEILDELTARRSYPGRPADLQDDDLTFVRVAAGRQDHPDPRFPVIR